MPQDGSQHAPRGPNEVPRGPKEGPQRARRMAPTCSFWAPLKMNTLGPSWAPLGPFLGPSWGPCGLALTGNGGGGYSGTLTAQHKKTPNVDTQVAVRTKEQRGHIGGIAYICAYSCSSSSIRPSLLRFLILLLLLLLLLLLIHLFLPAYVSTYQARAAHVPDTGRSERASNVDTWVARRMWFTPGLHAAAAHASSGQLARRSVLDGLVGTREA